MKKTFKNYLQYIFLSPALFFLSYTTSCKAMCINKTNKIAACLSTSKWIPKIQKYLFQATMGHKAATSKATQSIITKLFPKAKKIRFSKKTWKIFSKGKI